MNLTLTRQRYESWGIISELTDENDTQIAVTLEHAYPEDSGFVPKIPVGTYSCQRGMHQLEGMTAPFETFEITGVTGHTNILFHVGNFNKDSEGCVLLGSALGAEMVSGSKTAFLNFMNIQENVDEFILEVV
jgi:hypothetical protein